MSFSDREKQYLQTIEESYKHPSLRKDVGNLKYIDSLSNDRHALYFDSEKNNHILTVRGTFSKDEFITDINLIRGNVGGSLKETERYYNNLPPDIKKNIEITGHSLGATAVNHLASKNKSIKGSVFAPYAITNNKTFTNTLINSKRIKKHVLPGDIYFHGNHLDLDKKKTKIKTHKIKSNNLLGFSGYYRHSLKAYKDLAGLNN